MLNAAQNVQSAAGGVKFGANVVFSGEAVCDTAQNATTLSDVFKLLVNLAQMQMGQDATAQQLIKSVSVSASGTSVKIMASLPQDVFQSILRPNTENGDGRGHPPGALTRFAQPVIERAAVAVRPLVQGKSLNSIVLPENPERSVRDFLLGWG